MREFGPQDASSPLTNTVAEPPDAGTTQRSNPPICAVNTIHFPSGDQSGSEGFETPAVEMRWTAPPDAGILHSERRSLIFVAKQIHCPSGDQQGEESSSRVLVNCFKPLPSALATHKSTAPPLLRIMATFDPSGDGAGLMFEPG